MKNIIFLAASIFLLASCEGPQGPAGQDGKDGNANVKVYVYNTVNWNDNNYPVVATVSCSGITSDIMATGLVLGYVRYTNPNGSLMEWQLPWTYADENGFVENVLMSYSPGVANFESTSDDGMPSIYGAIASVKVVVIEGLAGKKAHDELELSWEDLVKRYPNMQYIYVN
jgi:hypothetical protein